MGSTGRAAVPKRWQRALVYAAAGTLAEVIQTGLKSPARDKNWRLTGNTYLWMFPIYAGAVLLEPVHDRLRARPVWFRGVVYIKIIYVVEAATGEGIRRITGEVPWDYTRPRGRREKPPVNWRGPIRPAYAPTWFLTGLGFEYLDDALMGGPPS